MRSLRFSLIPLILLMIVGSSGLLIVGCSGGGVDGPKISEPPPLKQATRIAVAPFITTPKGGNLGKRVPVNLATLFGTTFKNEGQEIEWIFDQSDKVNPVASKIQELGITLNDIYADPALAAKVGSALKADLIVVGRINDPKFKDRDYNTLLKRQGRQVGISGSATYIRKLQTARVIVNLKVTDAKTGELVYNDAIGDYLKYWYAYQTQQRRQITFREPSDMMADLGNHLPRRIAYILYPTGMPEVKEGVVLDKPDLELLGNQGVIQWD
jgi:hypothetical protein